MPHWLLLRERKIEYALYNFAFACCCIVGIVTPSFNDLGKTYYSLIRILPPHRVVLLHPDLRNMGIGRAGCQRA